MIFTRKNKMAETELDFEKIFKISLKAMKINNSHPDVKRNKRWLLRFLITHSLFTLVFVIMAQNVLLGIQKGDFSEFCRNSITSIIYIVITQKHYVMTAHQKIIQTLVSKMKADYARDYSKDEKKIMLEYALRGKNVVVTWLFLSIYAGSVFPIKHLVLEIYWTVKEGFRLIEVHPLTYPSPIEENKFHPVLFGIIYVILIYYVVYAAVMYVAFVPFGSICMLHACGQIEIVKKRARELYEDANDEEVLKRLREMVKIFQHVYSMVNDINVAFKYIYEIKLKSAVVLIPITSWEVLSSLKQGQFSIEFITFIFGSILIAATPCYYSDVLMEKGRDVTLAMYSCGWESHFEPRARRTIHIILLRSQNSIGIQAVFRTICLDALADVFRQAYGLFNLMNAAWG